MPSNENLTPQQQEALDAYTLKVQKEAELNSLLAQKEAEIALSKKKTVEKLNNAASGISLSHAATMEAFSEIVKKVNNDFISVEADLAAIEIAGGKKNG